VVSWDGTDADRTVEFGLDGVNYTIDLSDKNAGKLRKALDPYVAALRAHRSTRVARQFPAALARDAAAA
jgi:nucleoid-associated protein Lsr2